MHELLYWSLPLIGGPLWALARRPWRRRMKASHGLALGERLRDAWSFADSKGGPVALDQPGRALVLVFMSNSCPGVKAYDNRLRELARRFGPQGVRFVGVNSVPSQLYPSESLEGMRKAAIDRNLVFPYVKDRDQRLMQRMGAVCTPHVFVLDSELVLRYRGRIDDAFLESRARSHDLRDALNDVLARRPVARPETAPLGCTIDIAPAASNPPLSEARSLTA